MKVYIHPSLDPSTPDKGVGGIGRVIRNQYKYLPSYGIEIVDIAHEADVVNCHVHILDQEPCIVLSTHGLYWAGYKWDHWAHKANENIVRGARHANVYAVTTPSEWVANSMRRGMLLDPLVVEHGVDPDEWTPGEDQGYIFWGKNRIDPICTPEPLNELAKRLPQQFFVSTYGNHNLFNIKLLGTVPYEESKDHIRKAGIYLATVRETGGLTVMEAMSAGVPCLGWNWGVNSTLIQHLENGYLAKPGDYDDLVRGVEYIRKNRQRLSQNARGHIIENYHVRDRIKGYVDAYEKAWTSYRKKRPKVSVIITAYNLEQYLPDAIESVLHQDMEDWELIIVNDSSPDKCGEIADGYAQRDNRVRVLHNARNLYLAEARNRGIVASTGKYILPLDADDALHHHSLRLLSETLDRNPDRHIVTGSMELIEPNGDRWVSGWPVQFPSYKEQIKGHNQIAYASMFRRWVWEDVGGYRRRHVSAEDAAYWTRVMSFGAIPIRLENIPTLIYRNRPESMSHSIPTPDWTSWFIWRQHPELRPYGAGTEMVEGEFNPVYIYEPRVSVIIPVGKGHEIYLQDALDSLITQSFQDWEVIVINDTGYKWGEDFHYLQGYPFVRLIDSTGPNKGTAWARNRGIEAARTDYIVLLDADDYFQPLMLDVLYKSIQEMDGHIYTDWLDQEGNIKQAQDWNYDRLLEKMLGPSIGIYKKQDLINVGMFDESISGWEDWNLILTLAGHGVCGTRVAFPGFTYRYQTGLNRERDFVNRKDLLIQIRKKHEKLYQGECYS